MAGVVKDCRAEAVLPIDEAVSPAEDKWPYRQSRDEILAVTATPKQQCRGLVMPNCDYLSGVWSEKGWQYRPFFDFTAGRFCFA
jgi:hypothetical protein